MKDRIMLVGQENSFMTQTILHALTDAKFEVTVVAPNTNAILFAIDDVDILLFNLSDYVFTEKDVLSLAKMLVVSHNKTLGIIGDIPETQAFENVVPVRYISLRMSRPVNVRHLVSEMMAVSVSETNWADRREIVVVDDDSTFLDTVAEWLEDTGEYRVNVMNSGMQAITYLADHMPDLMLLDYEMPIVSGAKVLQMIRSDERTADLPIIFLTGKNDRKSVEQVLKLHPAGYILKTKGREFLVDQVRKYFDDKDKGKI